jgi:hypothetical protein
VGGEKLGNWKGMEAKGSVELQNYEVRSRRIPRRL